MRTSSGSSARVFARLDTNALEWKADQFHEALNVCRKLDEFARLVPYFPRTAMEVWGVPFAKAWIELAPVVERERLKSHWPEKWNAFAGMGEECLRKHPDVAKRPITEAARL